VVRIEWLRHRWISIHVIHVLSRVNVWQRQRILMLDYEDVHANLFSTHEFWTRDEGSLQGGLDRRAETEKDIDMICYGGSYRTMY
jgi:hypothetical protein